ncbi:COR domain-containing protein [Candidatus Parabeggiatoa sp. HSG14]|uniref:COR domain-containing protein n=1 Tax=Candidatus Parabeggiatoa sp. HSG14 TaxID=3055593 RepID=UPI0025A768C3|nr:COR domain-containing protein [Thiotrichales bacterium HSG14]
MFITSIFKPKIIRQLEQTIGKKLEKLDTLYVGSVGYVQNERNQITELSLYECGLKELPLSIVKLQNLTELDLGRNQLSNLPSSIVKLKNLTELDLIGNQLSELPPEIGQLQNLTVFDLSNNQLNQFPKVLLDLNLEVKMAYCRFYGDEGIYIEGNPFQTPPVEIVEQGRQAIIDYCAALEEQARPLNESKLILIGDGGAGKTSLMKRLLGLDFNPQESQTHGININALTLQHNDNDIKLHCWDFGGQQIMHATHQFFLSKRSLYLLVLDSRRETQVDYWLKHIQTFGGNAPVIIVINKIDENPHFDLPQQRQLKKRYPNFKQVCRISCATQQGISELIRTIQDTLPDIELLNTLFPAKWFKVKTAITEQAQKTNFTSYEHYVDICQANGITKESEQNTLINFLHDLGIVNHFQDRWLRETNVINPQWITEAVYTIINAPQLAGNGKLHRELMSTLLDNDTYPVRKHDYIIELMKKFELCYALNDNEYLLPDLFPTQEPNFEFDDEHALHFILEYDFLPKSIFTRFIVRMHRDILNNTYWRNGVLLTERTSNTTALVETDSNRLVLQIAGQQKREYLAILLFILKDIHRSFNNLTITEKIGLPDNPNLTVNHVYLLKLVQKGQTEYLPPENPEKSYNIMDLLGIVAPPSETEAMRMLQKILSILEAQGIEQEKDLLDHVDEVVKLNPGIFGVSIDVNALVKKMLRR